MSNASCGRCCRWCEGLGKRHTWGEGIGQGSRAAPKGGTGGESWGKLKVEGQGAGSLGEGGGRISVPRQDSEASPSSNTPQGTGEPTLKIQMSTASVMWGPTCGCGSARWRGKTLEQAGWILTEVDGVSHSDGEKPSTVPAPDAHLLMHPSTVGTKAGKER